MILRPYQHKILDEIRALMRQGVKSITRTMPPKYSNQCSVDGCKNKFHARNFCSLHYQRFKKHGDPLKIKEKFNYRGIKCQVLECCSQAEDNNMCGKHAQRYRRYGDPHYVTPKEEAIKRLREAQPKLGKLKPHVYKKFFGRHEHRLVMEQKIGRKLTSKEIVHHIDGNKHNNHPENLQSMSHSEHVALHRKQMILARITKKGY